MHRGKIVVMFKGWKVEMLCCIQATFQRYNLPTFQPSKGTNFKLTEFTQCLTFLGVKYSPSNT